MLVEQLLRKFLTAVFLLGIPAAWCSSTSPILSTGLNGFTTSVSWLRDSKVGYSINDLEHTDLFQSLDKPIQEWIVLNEIWLRIDIATSPTDMAREAYLQVKPAFLYDVQLHQNGAAPQRHGLGLAFKEHSSSSLTSVFLIKLDTPITRVYLRMSGVSLKMAQLKLISKNKLEETQQIDDQVNGVFFGAMLLMMLLTLLNWCFTREKVYRSYLFFLGSTLLFFLLSNSFVSAYVLPDQPLTVLLLLKFAASCVISSTIFFSILILRVDENSPRLARGMRWLAWTLILINLCVNDLEWIPILIRLNTACHLLCSCLFVAFSIRQFAAKRSIEIL